MTRQRTRRRLLRTLAGTATVGVLAGCTGGGGADSTATSESTPADAETATQSPTPTPTQTPTETETPTATDTPTPPETDTTTATRTRTPTETATPDQQERIDAWLAETSNYDGRIIDRTGRDSVSVAVGVSGNGGSFGFAPPAIRIDPGTIVDWSWTGDGGSHSVTADNGDFDSGLHSSTGHVFSHEFASTGLWRYYCTPHRSLGMKGAVVVG